MNNWWNNYLEDEKEIILNADVATLVQRSIHRFEGQLSVDGALIIQTGKHTGRSPDSKFVVEDNYSSARIDWENVKKISQHDYLNVKNQFSSFLKSYNREIYLSDRSVSSDTHYQLGLRLITTQASAALFSRSIFRDPVLAPPLNFFTILHCPFLDIEQCSPLIKGPTVILINFFEREILIAGTQYLGEIKKAVFSVMSTYLPDFGILPAHAGANIDEHGNVSVFFGLSGTGKTTLSTDIGKKIIGDDELMLTTEGVFNMEGGCYAKTFHLSADKEPQIYQAVNRFGTVIENVPLSNKHIPDFDSDEITENGRATYPLSFISKLVPVSEGKSPANIFFLSADAMGVLPAVSKLSVEQAQIFFLSGYTSKLSGTEINLHGVTATFSHCFGAPFMMRRPYNYGELLRRILEDHSVNVWLLNTGWYGGPYGVGKRYDLTTTRSIVRSIQLGLDPECTFRKETVFQLSVPEMIPGVQRDFLHPRELWSDGTYYDEISDRLLQLFRQNLKRFQPQESSSDLFLE